MDKTPSCEITPDIGSKNFILFAFKLLAIHDSAKKLIWDNEMPNSQFQIRPVTLLASGPCSMENGRNSIWSRWCPLPTLYSDFQTTA